MRQSRAFFQVIEELLFYGFHAVMRSPVYALCNTHRLLDTGADLLVDRNVFLRFQSHSEAVGNDSIKVCGRVLLQVTRMRKVSPSSKAWICFVPSSTSCCTVPRFTCW